MDYLNPDLKPACQIVERAITFDFSNREDIYKQNIIKSLLAAFHIALNEEEPILDKNIHILLEKSPELQKLNANDAVCILLTISEWDWDKERTPNVLRWLLRHFFEVELPQNSPNFYLFFGLTYEMQDSDIENEIKESIQAGEHGIIILPELEAVSKRDIARWFARYESIFETKEKQLQQRETYFPGREAINMEKVQNQLKKLIDEYNRGKL